MREISILKTSGKVLGKVTVSDNRTTIGHIKQDIYEKFNISVHRQSLRNRQQKGVDLSNDQKIADVSLETPFTIYVKDLGPQIRWSTVFYFEYAGPIFLYGILLLLPHCFYSSDSINRQIQTNNKYTEFVESLGIPYKSLNSVCNQHVVFQIQSTAFYAGILWTFHYLKRILETAFIHRFSHGTMPIFNLFKNCGYYWGFALYVAYHVNHPLHTPVNCVLFYTGFIIFVICELGNFSIHLLLRNLRPKGSTIRKIPIPNNNPLTKLYNYVSCPNYTYEFGSWIGFTLLTGCLPAFIFSLAGIYQMTVWAIAKHKKYKTEFSNYPKQRKAILPFLI